MTRRRKPLAIDRIEQLTLKVGPWLSCDDCFDQVDVVIDDLLIRRRPMPARFRAHLLGCSACREEARVLLELTALEDHLDAAVAVAELDAALAQH